ncbi:response regulator [Paenibacillus daejeonensis]|uniref:response regulator n=1 Tax=Paenibacillus daejeonensis TaxID=135193 RepID=UPI00036DBE98|nr:response regulator [Paenibacillus daejeonensis]
MYRVLIVDDEPEIRQGLRLKVKWEQIGMVVVGEAAHGGEAAERLEHEPIDIVITDMNMPVMDGLSFLDYCREQHPALRLIVITGYEDFQYAHAAIRNRVRDYLLKPVTRDELTSALQRIGQELDAERQSRDEASVLQWQMSQYAREMKEHFIVRLVRGELDQAQPGTIMERAQRFQLDAWEKSEVRFLTAGLPAGGGGTEERERLPEQFRLVFELLCREFAENWSELDMAAEDVAARPERRSANPGPGDRAEGAVERKSRVEEDGKRGERAEEGVEWRVISGEDAKRSSHQLEVFRDAGYPGLMHLICRGSAEQAAQLASALKEAIRSHVRLDTHVGVGEPVSGFGTWKDGYMSALIAWNIAGSPMAEGEPSGSGQDTAHLPEETVKVMRRYLARGETDAFGKAMATALEEAHAVSRAAFVKMIFQLVLILESAAAEAQLQLESREQLWLRPELVLGMHTVAKAEAFLQEIAGKIAERTTQGSGADADQSVIEAAKQFIEENYRYDLNLTMIAERFNYHPSYFSEFFKAKVGRTFIQYLSEVRMAEAVRLLKETTLSLWDIAEFTGFSNASYFSAKFKKVYGMSPSEYRSGQGQ